MRYLTLLTIILLLAFTQPIRAQDDDPPGDCGNGLPCGPIPWDLPIFPNLASPTPISENVDVNPNPIPSVTPTPTLTLTPTNTYTPSPTSTAFFDEDVLENNIATVSAIIDATRVPLINAEGTEIASGDAVAIASNASTFFSYFKGFSLGNTLGVFAPLLALFMLFFNLNIFLAILKFTLPIIAIVVGVVRKVVNVILNFT